MGIAKRLKEWGPIIATVIALAAVGLSWYTMHMNNVRYQEITKPHTEHDEIYDRLTRLDEKMERTEQSMIEAENYGEEISELQESLKKAKRLRDEAELAWDARRYNEADEIIKEAHDLLQEIQEMTLPPPRPVSWSPIAGLIGGAIVLSLVIWAVTRRRGEGHDE